MKPLFIGLSQQGDQSRTPENKLSSPLQTTIPQFLKNIEGSSIAKKTINLSSGGPDSNIIEALREAYREIGRADYLPISIGPETSLRFPLFSGLKDCFPTPKFGLIYIGPHLEVGRDSEIPGRSGVVGRLLTDPSDLLDGLNTLQIGWSLDPSEREREVVSRAAELGITVVSRGEINAVKAIVELAISTAFSGTTGVYISVDLAILGSSRDKGLTVKELSAIILGLIRRMPLIGIDFLGGPFAVGPTETTSTRYIQPSVQPLEEIGEMISRAAHLIENFTRSGEESTLFD